MFKLSPINKSDLELVLKWRNLKKIRYNMINNQCISWKAHCAWFENLQHRKDREFLLFSIDDRKVGIVSFVDINLDNQNCSWGFYVGEETTPKGTGTLMAYYALNYIFDKYNLHKINSQVFQFNEASVGFHENLKFTYTGVLKDEILRESEYQNLILFSLFKNDWDISKDGIYIKTLQKMKGEKKHV